jgi:mannose-1-phosphate guanylyltransferase
LKKVNLILSGGDGSRLWPLSTPEKPKQFLQIFEDKSLFGHTLDRNLDLVDEFFVVTNHDQWNLAKPQLEQREVGNYSYFLEPCARNTAPAIAIACMQLDPSDLVLVSPSDHMIEGSGYTTAVNKAFELAKEGAIVTFGIQPTEPQTGYGYIQANGSEVVSFHEKPEHQKAIEFITAKNYYWNSGMFAFKAGVFLEELEKYNTELFQLLRKLDLTTITREDFEKLPNISVDYAVMEHTAKLKMVAGNFDWTDLGSFESLFGYWEMHPEKAPHAYKAIGGGSYAYSDNPPKILVNNPMYFIDANGTQLLVEKGLGQEVKNIKR